MIETESIINKEYLDSTGKTSRIKVFVTEGIPEDILHIVQKHDPISDELGETIVLQHFGEGKWIERDAGESEKAQEYGAFIEANL